MSIKNKKIKKNLKKRASVLRGIPPKPKRKHIAEMRSDMESVYYKDTLARNMEDRRSLREALAPFLAEIGRKESEPVETKIIIEEEIAPGSEGGDENISGIPVVAMAAEEESTSVPTDIGATENENMPAELLILDENEVRRTGRRVIMWTGVAIISFLIIISWAYALPKNFSGAKPSAPKENFLSVEKYTQEIGKILENFNFDKIVSQIKTKAVEAINNNINTDSMGRVSADELRKISNEVVNEIKNEPIVKPAETVIK